MGDDDPPYESVSVRLRQEQIEWLDDNHINRSEFVRAAIDEYRDNEYDA